LQNNIEPVFFPSQTTHIMQPLDDAPFGLFGKNLRNEISNFLITNRVERNTIKGFISKATIEIARESFTKESIQAAFKHTGIFPFDEEILRQRAKENVGKVKYEELPKDSPFREGYRTVRNMLRPKEFNGVEYVGEAEVEKEKSLLASCERHHQKKNEKICDTEA